MTIKNAFRRGFTLIELMIVIVILGILMGTILPRLTGAQSRARDTSRIADLNNLAQALEVYFNDHGSYPAGGGCLIPKDDPLEGVDNQGDTAIATTDDGDVYTADELGEYLKGGEVIKPAAQALVSNGCKGAYFYAPLTKSGVRKAAYVLVSDVEAYQSANFNLTGVDIKKDGTSEYTNAGKTGISDKIVKLTAETPIATNSVYVVTP